MTISRADAGTATSPPPRVALADGAVRVQDERIFRHGEERLCERFLGRVLSVEGVCSVTLDRTASAAVVRYAANPGEGALFFRRLAAAIRDDRPLARIPPLPRGIGKSTCTIHRHGALLSTCRILVDRPGRLRMLHDELSRNPAALKRVVRVLSAVPGVRRVNRGPWTESLLIVFDPSLLSSVRLVRLIEEALEESSGWDRALSGSSARTFGLESASLGLAALTDLVVPALMPASAALLVATNVATFQAALRLVRQRKLGLPVLYTAIALAALASGQFLACALMSWFYKFWQGSLDVELAGERQRLLDECLPLPRLARQITHDGVELLVPVDRLRPGDQVVVQTDEPVPADGRVIDGEAIVDERAVRGLEGASRKRASDTLLAGSTILAGQLRFEVARLGDQTRATSIGRALISVSSPSAGSPTPARHGRMFADQAVAPTLATAGFGLLVGDLSAAAAILGPDYATGPGMSVSLETLRHAVLCTRRGIVPRVAGTFQRLAEADLIVLDDSPALRRRSLEVVGIQTRMPEPELLRYAASAFRHLADERASALACACWAGRVHMLNLAPVDFEPGVTVVHGKRHVRVREYVPAPDGTGPLVVEIDGTPAGIIKFGRSTRLHAANALTRVRDRSQVPFALVSNRPEADVATLAAELGVATHISSLSPDDSARFLRACRARGLKAVFVGDCRRHSRTATEAHIAVSFVGDGDLEADPAEVVLLQPRLDLFADLWEIARTHSERARASERFILVPNLLCVAAAFLFGATSLTSVMVTNLGTFGLYSRAVGSVRKLGPVGQTGVCAHQ
jgi:cation transport ATPase